MAKPARQFHIRALLSQVMSKNLSAVSLVVQQVAAEQNCSATFQTPASRALPQLSFPVCDRFPPVRSALAPPAHSAFRSREAWSRLSPQQGRHPRAKLLSLMSRASPAYPAASDRRATVPPALRALSLVPITHLPVDKPLRRFRA